jgi:hypothetical protein
MSILALFIDVPSELVLADDIRLVRSAPGQTGKKFFSNLFFELFQRKNRMGAHGADSGDPFIGDTRPVQAVQDLGQSKMDRCGSL